MVTLRVIPLFACTAMYAQEAVPAKGVNFYSLEKEQALGAQLAGEYRRQIKAVDSAAVLAYVNKIGNRLAPDAPGFVYTFAIVDGPDTLLHESAAFPGGYVFVPAGLIL